MGLLLIGGEKGGTRKATTATSLAAVRACTGRDAQGSAAYWAAIRDQGEAAPRAALAGSTAALSDARFWTRPNSTRM